MEKKRNNNKAHLYLGLYPRQCFYIEWFVPVWLCLSYKKGRVHGSPVATGR